MKKIALLIVGFLLVASVALANTPVVVVGGVGSNVEQLGGLKDSIPGAIAIVPEKMWSLEEAARDLLKRIREAGINGRFVIVAHSWGGLIARRMDADNPGVVEKIITIASPHGGFGPAFVRFFFDAGDQQSQTPLYVIAAYNNLIPKFYMGEERNDGVVDLKSALDLRGKKITEQKIVEGEHTEVLNSQIAIQLVKSWIN